LARQSWAVKTLLVLRHAKSSWAEDGIDDHARPLNTRGERDAPRMGRLLKAQNLLPDLIISSDAVRARSTAEAVRAAAQVRKAIQLEPRLYHASAAEIIAVLRAVVDEAAASVLIVGHNPGLEELLARLTGAHESFPTAALAHISLPIDRWSDLKSSTRGTLVELFRPKELE
jgi:phosphohistidine phosphatase